MCVCTVFKVSNFNNAALFGSGNGGESSAEQEFYGGLQGPSVRSPNSQQSSPHRSLSGQLSFPHLVPGTDH